MGGNKLSAIARTVQTASGRISYTEQGTGPVALFVHGVLLNGHLWRHQLADLSDIRRCLAVDLLAHGDTEITPDQDVSVTANAKMLREFLDALKVDQVDIVGNDSGGGIAQIFCRIAPAARPQPHAHGLRYSQQLATRSLQAVSRDGGCRRFTRNPGGDVIGQEYLPIATGSGTGV